MTVRHRLGSYEVRFVDIETALSNLPAPAYVITDSNLNDRYGTLLHRDVQRLVLEPGEGTKSPTSYLSAIEWLAGAAAQRTAHVVALGGGVIGDLAGFVAATYMRGVSFTQIPTSLLAQVDSSVGGKVGVDLPHGKNMLGAFYPPVEVRIATAFLATLPRREFNNGMAEVLKYGFIMAPDLLELSPELNIEDLVRQCIEFKRMVVEGDELETTGLRAILNFGHTVGHALEHALGYAELLHGEAISIGMVVEARLSENLGLAASGTAAEVEGRLARFDLPTSHPLLREPDRLIEAMRRDKKSSSGELSFSLLRSIGACELVKNIAEADVQSAFVG